MSKDVLTHVQERGEFVMLEDGYMYYGPKYDAHQHPDGSWSGGGGVLAAHELRAIADELDKRNAAWDAIVQSDTAIGELTPDYVLKQSREQK